MLTLKEYFKNCLLENLSENRRYAGRGVWENIPTSSELDAYRESRWDPNDPRGRNTPDYTIPRSSIQPFSTFLNPSMTPPTRAAAAKETREEAAKSATIGRMLNTVHHFSREHGIQLTSEHIKGIDFTNPDVSSHIRTISSRLGL